MFLYQCSSLPLIINIYLPISRSLTLHFLSISFSFLIWTSFWLFPLYLVSQLLFLHRLPTISPFHSPASSLPPSVIIFFLHLNFRCVFFNALIVFVVFFLSLCNLLSSYLFLFLRFLIFITILFHHHHYFSFYFFFFVFQSLALIILYLFSPFTSPPSLYTPTPSPGACSLFSFLLFLFFSSLFHQLFTSSSSSSFTFIFTVLLSLHFFLH